MRSRTNFKKRGRALPQWFSVLVIVAVAFAVLVIVVMVVLMLVVVIVAAAVALLVVTAALLVMAVAALAAARVVVVHVVLAVVVVVGLSVTAASAALTLTVVMVVIVVMAVALIIVVMVVTVLMVVVMAVAVLMFLQLVVEACVVEGMVHDMLQLVLVDIEHSAHECEVDFLLRGQVTVLLHAVAQVGEVEGDPGAVVEGDSSLDVSEHGSSLGLHPLPDLQQGLGEPCLSVGVVSVYRSAQSGGAASRFFQ